MVAVDESVYRPRVVAENDYGNHIGLRSQDLVL